MRRVFYLFLAVAFLTGCQACVSRSDTWKPEPASKSQIILLGTGTPNAEPDRSGPAAAIVVNGISYIVDCGPGVVRRAQGAYEKYGIEALKACNLRRLFITHLHTDHTLGYPDLIFTCWVLELEETLEVYGPPGTGEMTEHLLEAYKEDIEVRLGGLEPANAEGYKVNIHEIKGGYIYEDENVKVKAFRVKHGAWDYAFGYRFETPGRVIVISGDRAPVPDIAEEAKGCDVLIHEVYSVKGFQGREKIWQDYHRGAHTSSVEVGELAKRVQPGLVILTHQLLWGATPEELLEEIRQVYDGKVVSGKDLDIY